MLSDLQVLLDAVPEDADYAMYERAVREENVLGKSTASTRQWAWKKLRELYALDPEVPLFKLLRRFWAVDRTGRPLLATLLAIARDSLLRASVPVIASTRVGESVTRDAFKSAIVHERGERFSEITMKAILSHLMSSWTESGHLKGGKEKVRSRVTATTATTTFALALGYLTGVKGELLFSTQWTSILDSPSGTLHDHAREASRLGWLKYRGVGTIIDLTFSDLVPQGELPLDE